MLRAFRQNDVLMLCLALLLLLLLLLLPLCTGTGVAALTGDPELLLKLVQSLSVEQLLVRVIESAAGSHTPPPRQYVCCACMLEGIVRPAEIVRVTSL
jgi:hypothetical protein